MEVIVVNDGSTEDTATIFSSVQAARLGFTVIGHSEPEILLVSHDLVTIERVCHRVVWLDQGRIRDILDSYRRFQQGAA